MSVFNRHLRVVSLLFIVMMIGFSLPVKAAGNIVELDGKWEFYWQQLLKPGEFAGKQAAYINVPLTWRGQSLDQRTNQGKSLPRDGYATYRLLKNMSADSVGQEMSLSVRYVSSAYRIWIDGREYKGLGRVGTSAAQEMPDSRALRFDFRPQSTQIEIILQVSNFSYSVPGITEPVVVGPAQLVADYDMQNYVVRDLAFTGLFLGLALFHFVLFSLRRDETSLLWLGLVSLTATSRTFFINEHFVQPLIPSISWEWILRIQYLSDVLLFLCIVLYTRSMFLQEMKNGYMRIFYGYVVLFSGFILLASTEQFSSNTLAQYTFAVFCMSLLIQTTVLAVFRQREGASLNAFALTTLVFSVIHDTLYYANIIDSVPLAVFFICLYLFLQAFIVARRYAFTMRKSQELSHRLTLINTDLELQVKQRTQERINFLTNVAHDIGSPLLSVQTSLMLLRDGSFPSEKQAELLELMVSKSGYARQMVQDMFDLLKLESGEVELNLENVSVAQFITDVVERFRLEMVATGKRVELSVHETKISTELEQRVEMDIHRMLRVMQNLLDNAVKFSRGESGRVELKYEIQTDKLCVEVTDFGEGIEPELLPYVFNRFYVQKNANPNGSGIGLSVVKEIIERHKGEVGVRSVVGKGSTFFFTIPLLQQNA